MYEGGLENSFPLQITLQQRLDLALISQGFVTIPFGFIAFYHPQTLIAYGWSPLMNTSAYATLRSKLFPLFPTVLHPYLPTYRTEHEENVLALRIFGFLLMLIGFFSFYTVASVHNRLKKLVIVLLSFVIYLGFEIGITLSLHERLTWVNYISAHPGPRTILTALLVFHFVTLLTVSSAYWTSKSLVPRSQPIQLTHPHHQQHHQRQQDHELRHRIPSGETKPVSHKHPRDENTVPLGSGSSSKKKHVSTNRDRTEFERGDFEPSPSGDSAVLPNVSNTVTSSGQMTTEEPMESTEEWTTVKNRKIRRG